MSFKDSLFLPVGRQEQTGSPDFSLKRIQFVMPMNDVQFNLYLFKNAFCSSF